MIQKKKSLTFVSFGWKTLIFHGESLVTYVTDCNVGDQTFFSILLPFPLVQTYIVMITNDKRKQVFNNNAGKRVLVHLNVYYAYNSTINFHI